MNLISISQYSPLIQFLAGIYLLIIYIYFFDIRFVRSTIKFVESELNKYKLQFQGQSELFNGLNEPLIDKEKNEKSQIKSLKRVYGVSLLYCITLLLYSGVEQLSINNNYVYGLIPVGIIMIVYTLYLYLQRNYNHHIRKYGYIIATFFFWIFVFLLSRPINDYFISKNIILINISIDVINLFAVLLVFWGLFFSLHRVIKYSIWKYKITRGFRRIDKLTTYYSERKTKTLQTKNKKLEKQLDSIIGKVYFENDGEIGEILGLIVVDRLRIFLKNPKSTTSSNK